jgi:hypothetical protein
MAVSYLPQFQHTDWIDNVDRVRAAGDNGFNLRFHGLEFEFKQLSDVIKQLNDAIDALSQKPPPKPVSLSLVPILAGTGDVAWKQEEDSVLKPGGATAASGVMNVTLPSDTRIQSLRVVGIKQSGTLGINLRRQSISGATDPQRIMGVDAPTGGFDQTAAAPNTDVAKIDNDNFRYYLTADLSGAGAADLVTLSAFQFTYIGV